MVILYTYLMQYCYQNQKLELQNDLHKKIFLDYSDTNESDCYSY